MINFIEENLLLIIIMLIGAVVCLIVVMAIFKYELSSINKYITEERTQRYVTKDGHIFIVTRREANLLNIISAEEARYDGVYNADNNPSEKEAVKGKSAMQEE